MPGHYTALFVAYAQIGGQRAKMLILNYADGTEVLPLTWADWCSPSSLEFFTWAPTHRLAATGPQTGRCGLVTRYVAVDPSRTLTSITLGPDAVSDGGPELPGDTITDGSGRTVIGALTLASADATLGGYGFVSGHFVDATGAVLTTPAHDGTSAPGYDVFVLSPALGNYGAAANIDGSYTLGLPAGTYTLSAAVRDGQNPSAGPQATPVTVTVAAGRTTKQDITILASPTPRVWGELKGTVKDASGNPMGGRRSSSRTAPAGRSRPGRSLTPAVPRVAERPSRMARTTSRA